MKIALGLILLSLIGGEVASAQTLPGAAPSDTRAPSDSMAPQSSPAGSTASSVSAPFKYQLGQTTLESARAYWSQNGMQILQEGNLSLGTGSGMDGGGAGYGVAAEKVVLVDVSGVDFEGVSMVRFAFYDGKLYRIQASLTTDPLTGQVNAGYTQDQMNALIAKLKKEYGAPSEAYHTVYAERKSEKDLMIWLRGNDKLVLASNMLSGALSLRNDRMDSEVQSYVKAYCRTINTKKLRTCW